jgi:hypothetical protein
MSSTNLCTIGFPAIGISGFGMVNVCGRNREPRPAIGTIIFILNKDFKISVSNILYQLVKTKEEERKLFLLEERRKRQEESSLC